MRLILDANVLILLVVGSVRRDAITKHKRLGKYGARDFDRLKEFIGPAKSIVLLPHVLAETSNLAVSGVVGELREQIFVALARLIRRHGEHPQSSLEAAETPIYRRLGLTDAALLASARPGFAILSDDGPLCLAARQAGLAIVPFDAVRTSL